MTTDTAATRDELVTAIAAERDRQVEQRLLVRRYVARMFADDAVLESGEPCSGGTARWLHDHDIPAMAQSTTRHNGYDRNVLTVGSEDAARAAALRRLDFRPASDADGASVGQLRGYLTEKEAAGRRWRVRFVTSLRQSAAEWRHIPGELVEELIGQLDGTPNLTPVAEETQAAPAAAVPARAVAQVMAGLVIRLPLPANTARWSDAELQDTARNAVRYALRNAARSAGGEIVGDVNSTVFISRG